MRAPAACGGCREPSISAAVEKPEDQREPERFFGHRKADQILPPQPPWYTGYDTVACVLLCFSRFGKSEFTGTGIRKPHMV